MTPEDREALIGSMLTTERRDEHSDAIDAVAQVLNEAMPELPWLNGERMTIAQYRADLRRVAEAAIDAYLAPSFTPSRPVTQHMVIVDLPEGLPELPPGSQILTRRWLDSGHLECDVRTSPGGTWIPVQLVAGTALLRFEEA